MASKTKNPKVIHYPDMQIIMRKDFYDTFEDHLKEVTKETGATYFGHNIIKNYRENGHRISTFCNHEAWHDLYWDKYYNEDPLEQTVHQAVQNNNFMALSWKISDSSSPCNQERLKQNKVKDGIFFSFKRPKDYTETFLIGWNHLKTDKLDTDYLFHLTSLLKPIRDHHWAVHDKV